ncbi:DASH family cryptochrome [Pseudohalioglobus sediminis]|uniref:Cryptochrome DASH n=1 Tax=Pseudohalioglobus sediminis TaxID=2606449 RepID=A0A5B0WXV1_9GAMM|nr:DASH family cryptochrome [Pseudohalioglobus sediminis]KAA1191843.1 DASH family cryptochrome [Pseudohalioglobus sediminis]
MRKLYWFQNDLRVQDNPGLLAQQDAERLLLVYLFPVNRPWCNVTGMGAQRERFLRESLQSLQRELGALGQNLLVLHGSAELVIPELVRDYGIDEVATTLTPGYYERRTRAALRSRLPVPLRVHEGNNLFREDALPFALADLPGQFTPFRKAVEALPVAAPQPAPTRLPRPPAAGFEIVPGADEKPHTALPIRGGTPSGQRRLRQFIFDERSIERYKHTRNCLNPLEGSSTLSPWLATGALSPREVVAAVRRFEDEQVANESTYWLVFELLWREFFHWRAYQDDVALFRLRPAGGRKRLHNCTFEPRSFARWCSGSTDFPLVNALMRQLVATGWMSNRGRQIAASCLVNELDIDWRYGAAFFEKHLLDFDVASNYGNWQYLAGVGADPRGGRHFNLAKQASEYDPEGHFVEKWQGRQPQQPKYVTDAADWPIVGTE